MPRNAYDVQIQEWEKLLKEVGSDEAGLAGVAPFHAALERAHAKVVQARKQRDDLYAASQEATRSMYRALEECRDAGISLRSYIKSVLGARTEKLSRYGIKPLRSRGRRRLSGGCASPS